MRGERVVPAGRRERQTVRSVHHSFADSALATGAHCGWRRLVNCRIIAIVHRQRRVESVHHPVEAELIFHHGIGRWLLHVVCALCKWRRRVITKARRPTKVQLRWVYGAPMAHQHVAEVGIEATIDRGSPKPTRKVH